MKKARHILKIEKIVLGGQGLARLDDGLVVLVPYVLPGETVEVELVSQKKNHAVACLRRVIEPSSKRVSPPCRHYADCGGCDLQHASYACQLEVKTAYFGETLAREIEPACFSEIQSEPVLGCCDEFHYRQRIRLQRDGFGALGFYKKGSHEVIDIDSCPLAIEELNLVLAHLKEGSEYGLLDNAHAVELLFSPADRKVVVIVHLTRKPRAADLQSAKQLHRRIDLVKSVWIAVEGFALSGPHLDEGCAEKEPATIGFSVYGSEVAQPIKFSLEPGGFCQVNLSQNQALITLLLRWVKEFAMQGRALDLFSGMGNFSLPLAQAGFAVTAMDVQRASIRSAQRNAASNGIDNCNFSRSDAQKALEQLSAAQERFDLILLDPPRQGCKYIISELPSLGAEYIVYISCDPATVARDLARLAEVGYRPIRCRGVDMFPQTHHVESISLLKRRERP